MTNKFIILVIEDEVAYLDLVSSELTRKGYKVIKAMDGVDGLAKAKKVNPDLILLDIRMSKMDGIKMLDLLRKYEKARRIKVIILTNIEPDNKIIDAVISDQPHYYFIKSDIKFDELINKIDEMLVE